MYTYGFMDCIRSGDMTVFFFAFVFIGSDNCVCICVNTTAMYFMAYENQMNVIQNQYNVCQYKQADFDSFGKNSTLIG